MYQAAEGGLMSVERQIFGVTPHCCSCMVCQVISTTLQVEMPLASGSIVSGNCVLGHSGRRIFHLWENSLPWFSSV